MPWVVSTETNFTDDERRQRIYAGEVFCIPSRDTVRALTDFALEMVTDAFANHDPLTAHNELRVEDYVDILKTLKPTFTHHPSGSYEDLLRCPQGTGRPTLGVPIGWAWLQLQTPSGHVVLGATMSEQLVDTDRR
jgi:hypothetical protein